MSTPFFVPSFCFKSMLGTLAFLTCMSCTSSQTNPSSGFIGENVDFARTQLGLAIDTIEASGKCLNPVTLNKDGKVYYCGYADWRSGFFPGSISYLYELTGDSAYLPLARKYTEAIRKAENLTWHHDIGFIVNCSFGNGLRLSPDTAYVNVMVQAARSLSTRFRPNAQVIQSWDVKGNSWQSERGWECPVIIDNMMNLELLFEATKLSGDSTFYRIAVAHADRTLTEHFRIIVVIMWWITTSTTGQYATNRLHKDIPTNLYGRADKHGPSMDSLSVTVKQRIENIWTRHLKPSGE